MLRKILEIFKLLPKADKKAGFNWQIPTRIEDAADQEDDILKWYKVGYCLHINWAGTQTDLLARDPYQINEIYVAATTLQQAVAKTEEATGCLVVACILQNGLQMKTDFN